MTNTNHDTTPDLEFIHQIYPETGDFDEEVEAGIEATIDQDGEVEITRIKEQNGTREWRFEDLSEIEQTRLMEHAIDEADLECQRRAAALWEDERD